MSVPLWGCVIFIALILLNGAFYGFSAAIQNMSISEIEKKAQEGNKKAVRLEKLIGNPRYFVNTLSVVATLFGISFGTFMVAEIAQCFKPYIPETAAYLLVIILSATLLASLGILAFRRIGTAYPEKTAFVFLNTVWFFVTVFKPLVFLATELAVIVSRLCGISTGMLKDDVTEEEIISMVGEAHEQGVIEENEAEMIQNIISFNEKEARDIMTHRKNIVAFEENMLFGDAVEEMLNGRNSRYPVYSEDLDNIKGIIHFKDAMKIINRNPHAKRQPICRVSGLVRQVGFVPETRSIGDLFQSMQIKKMHLAIVVDEYGQTAGLVAMEDILEEIVGDILDEYDQDEDNISKLHDNSVLIDGLTHLEDVEEELGIDFGDSEFETLNGYLTSVLGHIPTKKDHEVITDGYRFQILSLGRNTIGKVRAEKIKEKKTKGEEKSCQDIQNLQI